MIDAFIQARMSSTRFPGKVLKPILGKPMLELEIERVKACRSIDRVVVVTSVAPEDRRIVDICESLQVDVFCGSLDNVLDRFYQAALKFNPEHIVRLTGDCPLLDGKVVDRMVELYLERKCDYGTNCMPPTYPDGLDAEIFSFKSLNLAKSEAFLPSHLEHISLFFEEQPERFKIVNLANSPDLSGHRWTVDEPEDFEFVKIIFENLYPLNPSFGMDDVLALLEKRPELVLMNNKFMRNEGLLKSKEKDSMVLECRDSAKNLKKGGDGKK
jgi:spore coat polysaccharide biosynthesis protein SpsF